MSTKILQRIRPEHIGLLEASLRAPSAHNAQPWKIRPLPDGSTYELIYDYRDYLPEDPDDRDAYLTMGAFIETIVLEAPNFNLKVDVELISKKNNENWCVAKLLIKNAEANTSIDPLSKFVSKRITNRNTYSKEPLPPELELELKRLGNTLVKPELLKDVMIEASMKSWNNPRFVRDLKVWYREDLAAPDGFTGPQMRFDWIDVVALKFAFWRKQLKSKIIERLYSTRDVSMFTAAPTIAVLGAENMNPETIVDAGRRLLRSWVSVTAAGYSCHPFSITIDEKSTAPQVAHLTGVQIPVALYRIGKASKPAYGSNRKKLEDVIID